MITFTAETSTSASPAQAWRALIDITDWPRWTPSYKSIEQLNDGPVAVGSQARVRQPRLAPAIYQVTEIDEGRNFTWTSEAAGTCTVARHRLVPTVDGGTRIELAAELSGWLAGPVKLILGRRIQRYVNLEANGIKAAAEAARDHAG
jgi:uncharacterized protein YndB with AHSA1/START domain